MTRLSFFGHLLLNPCRPVSWVCLGGVWVSLVSWVCLGVFGLVVCVFGCLVIVKVRFTPGVKLTRFGEGGCEFLWPSGQNRVLVDLVKESMIMCWYDIYKGDMVNRVGKFAW